MATWCTSLTGMGVYAFPWLLCEDPLDQLDLVGTAGGDDEVVEAADVVEAAEDVVGRGRLRPGVPAGGHADEDATDPAAADGEDVPVDPALLGGEEGADRGDVRGVEPVGQLAEQPVGHPGGGGRRDGVDQDAATG